jgi:twitching motility protein PilT
MRFDRLGIIGLVEEARACSASSVFLRTGSKPMFRVGPALVTSRFSSMTRDDAIRVEKMLARDSGVLDKATNEVRQDEFVCTMADGGRVRVTLVRGKDGPAIGLNLIPTELPSLETVGLPANGGIVQLGGSINLVGGHRSKEVGVALIQDYCSRQPATVVTMEQVVEYDLKGSDSWIVQQCLGGDVDSFARGLAPLNGGNVDLLYVEGLSSEADALSLIELAEQGVDLIVSLRSGAIDALESAFMTIIGDSVKDANVRVGPLIGNKYTLGRSEIRANPSEGSQQHNVPLLSISHAV